MSTKPIELGKLVFTPETGRLEVTLSIEDCHALAVMLILSVKKRKKG
jgi:hypothetical protein